MFENIFISNFRGIHSLEVGDLRRMNLLVGKNNCGKSTILESFFLLAGISNPRLLLSINELREILLEDDDEFIFLFNLKNMQSPIQLDGKIGSQSRKLVISQIFNSESEIKLDRNRSSKEIKLSYQSTNSSAKFIEGISYKFIIDKKAPLVSKISIRNKKISRPKNYIERFKCKYLRPFNLDVKTERILQDVVVNRKLDTLLSVLKKIEPNIKDIRIGIQDNIFIDVGLESLIPLRMAGDGLRNILFILLHVIDMENGILLIDEIDSGFHYSSLSVLWDALIAASKDFNVQIIATTHSNECISAFEQSYSKAQPDGDDIRLFRIDRTREGIHKSYKFDREMIRTATVRNIEIR